MSNGDLHFDALHDAAQAVAAVVEAAEAAHLATARATVTRLQTEGPRGYDRPVPEQDEQ